MQAKTTEYFQLYFYDNYVMEEVFENVAVDKTIAEATLRIMLQHFEGKEFSLISHRKNNSTIDLDIYSLKIMKKVRGIAVVSQNPLVKERAIAEQMQFGHSFAFFNNLEDAHSWAKSMVYY